MSIEEKINYVKAELEFRSHTNEYINQWCQAINDAKHKLDSDTFSVLLNTQMKTLEQTHKDNNIILLKKENVEIKKEILILKVKKDIEIKELKCENKDIKKQSIKLENEKIYDKYLLAIYDTNRFLQLEKILANNYRDAYLLAKLRKEKEYNNYYIYEPEDSKEEIKYKLSVLKRKLNNMSEDIKKMFVENYETLLDQIIPYITDSDDIQLTEQAKYRIDKYWE